MKGIIKALAAVLLCVCATICAEAKTSEPRGKAGIEQAKKDGMMTANVSAVMEYVRRAGKFDEECAKYVKEELKTNPKNYMAYTILAEVSSMNYDFAGAYEYSMEAAMWAKKTNKYITADAYTVASRAMLMQRRYEKARMLAEKAVKMDKNSVSTNSALGNAYFYLEDYKNAMKCYEKCVKLGNKDPEVEMHIGKICFLSGEYAKAIEMAMMAKEKSGKYAGQAFKLMMLSDMKMGNVESALVSAYGGAISGDDVCYGQMLQFLAGKGLDEKRENEMVEFLRDRQGRNEETVMASYFLGCYYYDKALYGEALGEFNKCLGENTGIDVYDAVQRCYGGMGKYAEQVQVCDMGLRVEAYSPAMLLGKAEAYKEMGMKDSALVAMGKLVDRYPDYADGRTRRGFLLKHYEMYEDAMEDFKYATALAPEDAYGWFCRAECHRMMGDTGMAKECYEKSLARLDTSFTQSYKPLLLFYLGREKEALGVAREFCANNPSGGGYYNTACVYAQMGRKEDALLCLRLAFNKGYTSFKHMEMDKDLDPIRGDEEYIKLIEEYKAKGKE